jgi:hypothetical protein
VAAVAAADVKDITPVLLMVDLSIIWAHLDSHKSLGTTKEAKARGKRRAEVH